MTLIEIILLALGALCLGAAAVRARSNVDLTAAGLLLWIVAVIIRLALSVR